MMVKTYDRIVGLFFLLAGILGFVPALLTNNLLFNVFMVDPVHNIIHIVSGLVLLMVSYASIPAARNTTLAFAVIYGIITILGFMQGQMVLGLFMVNTADNILHLFVSLTALAVALPNPYSRTI